MIRPALRLGFWICLCGPLAVARAQTDEPLSGAPAELGEGTSKNRLTLDQLTRQSLAANPGIYAAAHNSAAAKQQLAEAERAWWPSFTIEGVVAPSVDIHCAGNGGVIRPDYCLEADVRNPIQSHPTGALTRWEIRMGFPILTFGKLSAAGKLAGENVEIAQGATEVVRAELVFNVKRSYYGAQVSFELMDMIRDGLELLDKAVKQVEDELERGKGKTSESDRLRLRVAEALIRARSLEAIKGEHLAIAALRTLVPGLPAHFDLDTRVIQPVPLPPRSAQNYIDTALSHRPEAKIVQHGILAAKANQSLHRSNFFPDILLVGSYFRLWKTTDNDEPSSPYMLHPFSPYGYTGGLVFRWELDMHLKIPRYSRAGEMLDGAVATQAAFQDGVRLETTSAYESMKEADQRIGLLKKAEKAAHSWLTAVAQNFAIGTAEAREFNDALIAYFDARGRYLQAIYDYNIAVAQLGRLVGTELK